jgi:hypothetical protein
MSNLTDILEAESSGTVDRPKPLPRGSYLAIIEGQPEYGKSDVKGTDFVKFLGKILEPQDDVDADEVAEWAKREDGTKRQLRGTPLPRGGITFYLTPDALWRLDKFLEDLGILEKGEKRKDLIDNASGKEFIVNINHQSSDDGQVTYANVKSTAPVE